MKSHTNDELVNQICEGYCDTEGGVDHPLSEAWQKVEEKYGTITYSDETSRIYDLFEETVRYVVDLMQLKWD